MTLTELKFGGDRPFPFIFCSKNYMLTKYGGLIDYVNSGGVATVNSSFPVDNIIDGNRASFAKCEKVGMMDGGNYIDIKVDLSGTDFDGDVENLIDFLLVECDTRYPCRKFEIKSYCFNWRKHGGNSGPGCVRPIQKANIAVSGT